MCGDDITGNANDRLKGKIGRISFEVITAIDGTWNGGHVCRKCLISAINSAQHGVQPTRTTAPTVDNSERPVSAEVAGG